jgi:hypothetical protein
MLVAQVKPETLYGVHQRSPPQTWLVRIGLHPPGTEVNKGHPRVSVASGRGRLCGDLCKVPAGQAGSGLLRRLALKYAARVAGLSSVAGGQTTEVSNPSGPSFAV